MFFMQPNFGRVKGINIIFWMSSQVSLFEKILNKLQLFY